MTLNEQKYAIDDLKRKIADYDEKITALAFRASEQGEMFSLIGATLQSQNPEFVVAEGQSSDPAIAPPGKVIAMASDLISKTNELTKELRETIRKRDDLRARLR